MIHRVHCPVGHRFSSEIDAFAGAHGHGIALRGGKARVNNALRGSDWVVPAKSGV